MSTFFNHTIHAIPSNIMADMDILVTFAEGHGEDKENDAAVRVETYLAQYRNAERIQNERENIVDHLTAEQEVKLAEECMKDYHGDKDHWEDSYERFLEDLTLDDYKRILGL